MAPSREARYRKGPFGRAVIAGVLAAVGVALGISIEELTYTSHRSTEFGASSTADPSTTARRRTE
jgi:hypothetical protein